MREMVGELVHPISLPLLSAELRGLHASVEACRACELGCSRARAVPGEGPCPAGIVLVGEAPGAREDATGRPFIGVSGKRLTQALHEAGIDRHEVFVTSVLKCRPPENRAPKPQEVLACRTHLDAQLRTLAPRVVVLLGATAASARLGRQAVRAGLEGLRGRPHRPDPDREPDATWQYVCTVHPAAALRFPNRLGRALVADLSLAKGLADASL